MAVKQLSQITDDQSGQSILEFMLMLPMMIGLVLILVRVNSAIQVSIVNQQYARAQAHWLAFNSPNFPQRLKAGKPSLLINSFIDKPSNRMVIGVSENNASGGDDAQYTPEATTQLVARSKAKAGPDNTAPGDDSFTERGTVRIRTTVAMCTQTNVISGISGKLEALTAGSLGEHAIFQFCLGAAGSEGD